MKRKWIASFGIMALFSQSLSVYAWTDSSLSGGVPIKSIHIDELRSAIDNNEGSQWFNVPGGITYTEGNVGVGVAIPGSKLDVSGNATISGSLTQGGYKNLTHGNLLYNGDFETGNSNGWSGVSSVVSGGYAGKYTAQFTGSKTFSSNDYIPVDPDYDVLQLEAFVKKTTAGSTPGVLYFGFFAYDENKTVITTAPCGTYCYFATSGWTIPVDGNWHKVSATRTGEGTSNPKFPVGTKFIRVLGLVNYSGSGDAVTQIDHISLKKINNGPLFVGNNFSSTNWVDQYQTSKIYTTSSNNLILEPPSSGNVGIGTTSPNEKLQVAGDVLVASNGSTQDKTTGTYTEGLTLTGGNMRLVIDTSDVINGGAYIQTRHESTAFPTATYNLALNPIGGNVGIGTTTPNEKLQVAGDVTIDGSGSTIGASNVANGSLKIGTTLGMDNNEIYFSGTDGNFGVLGANNLNINVNGSTKMRVMSSGNVGIGTTTPAYKLDVNGTARFTGVVKVPLPISAEDAANRAFVEDAVSTGDADKLDGLDSTQFLRSDADDSFSGSLVSTARNKGIFGTYDSYKTDQIWSMGTSYKNAADGSNFGNLYGLAYKHTNNPTGGTMAGGHQMVWVANGSPKSAMGTNLWTSGTVTGTRHYATSSPPAASNELTRKDYVDGIVSDSTADQSATRLTTANDLASISDGWYKWASDIPAGAPENYMAMVQQSDPNQKIQMAFGGSGTGEVYVRRADSGVFYDWARMWNEDNDGAGTGLDADKWDGQQFSSYLNQAVLTTSAPTFATINTGQGANELYDMNQNVLTTSSPTFDNLKVSSGNGDGVCFWGDCDNYTITMGNDQADHGWVTNYSMHMNMGTIDNRGFTWGYSKTAVVASLEAETGNFDTNGLVRGARFYTDNTVPVGNDELASKWYVDDVAGGNVGNADTLDNLDSTQFLRSDTSDVMSGNLRISNAYPLVMGSDGMLKVKSIATASGSETVSLQTSIDSRTDDYVISSYGGDARHLLVLQPQGGRVGIGTTSPTNILTIGGGANNQQISRETSDGSDNGALFIVGGGAEGTTRGAGILLYGNEHAGNPGGLRLESGNGADISLEGGNVGIGTTTPAYKLDVSGNARFTGNVTVPAPINDTDAANRGFVEDTVTDFVVDQISLNENSVLRIANPIGASYSGSSTVTGALKITLPNSWTNTMMKMTVEVFDYTTNESITLKLGGYNYSGTPAWHNTFAQIIASQTNRDFNVRFGHDGSKCAIYIGETGSTWSYPKVTVTDFQAGYSNFGITQWDDGWSIAPVTSLGTISSTLSGNMVAAGDLNCVNCVNDTDVADNSLTAGSLAAGSVGTSEVADNSLTASDLAAGSVGSSEVSDNSLTASDLAPNSVGNSELIDAPTVTDLYADAWLRNNTIKTGLYNSATGKHFYSQDTNYWVMNSNRGLMFRDGYDGAVQGYTYYDDSGNFGLLSPDSTWAFRTTNSDTQIYNPLTIPTPITDSHAATKAYVDDAVEADVGNADTLDGLDSTDFARKIVTMDNISTRTDSGFWQSSTPTTAEGWPEDSSWYHLLTSTHSNTGSYYSMQFAGDFYDSKDLFYRATGGSGTTGWNRVWHAGNDGAGTGLDADKLDGISSASFLRSDANDTTSGKLTVKQLEISTNTQTTTTDLKLNANSNISTDNSMYFWVDSASDGGDNFYFRKGAGYGTGTTLMTILNNAKVGIGITNPQYGNLEVKPTTGDANTGITLYDGSSTTARSWIGSGDLWHLTRGSTATTGITLNSSGSVGIGTTNPGYKLDVSGTARFTGNVVVPTPSVASHAANKAYVDTIAGGNVGNADTLDNLDSTQFLRNDYLSTRSLSDANSADGTGVTAYFLTGSATNKPSGTDHSLLTLAYSNLWSTQMAGDWRTNNWYVREQNNGTWGGWDKIWTSGNDGAGTGLSADNLDGISSGSFLRSDADDSFSGSLVSTARNKGIFGTYDSYKTDQIWSMGTSYKNAADGSNFGNLYGLAYKHTNNTTGGTMAGGHQMVWVANGSPKSAMGTNLWTSGTVTGTRHYATSSPPAASNELTRKDYVDGIVSDSTADQSATRLTTANDLASISDGWYKWASDIPVGAPENYMAMVQQSDPNQKIQMAFGGSGTGEVYVRRADSGVFYDWARMWNEDNDGAGTGLDADKLDNIDSTAFSQDRSVDYVTPGTNANDMRNVNKAYYARSANNANFPCAYGVLYPHENYPGSYGDGSKYITQVVYCHPSNTVKIRNSGGNGVTWSGWVTQFNTTTDGAGSGLDADLWDGQQFSSYLNQAVLTTSAPTFATINTGQGANELYDMNQNVLTTSSPTFDNLKVSSGNGDGVCFWGDCTNYTVTMGNDQADHGWVTDYSMHMNMGTTDNRGFTWGYSKTAVVASLEAETGNFDTNGLVRGARFYTDNKVPVGNDELTSKEYVDDAISTGTTTNATILKSSGNYNITDSTTPATLGNGKLRHDFINTFTGGGSVYRSILSLSSYTGGQTWTQLAFNYNSGNSESIYYRNNNYNDNAWGSWNKIWSSNNDGSGSGLNADLLDDLTIHTGRNNEANKIVRTDGSGYLQTGWINTTSGATTSAPARIYGSPDSYLRYYTPTTFASVMEPYFDDHFWQAANDGSGSGLDADLLDGLNQTSASTANTIVARNGSGDINARLFRSEYDTTNSTIGYIMTQVDTASDNYIRPSTPAQLVAGLGLQAGGSRDIWVEKAGDTVSGELKFSNANGIQWESGVNRITHNDGGGNVQIRFGNDYSSSDERFTHSGTAFYIGGNLDSSSGSLSMKVASNGGAGNDQPVTWGDSLTLGPTSLTFPGEMTGLSRLEVNGAIKLGTQTTCNATYAGTIRWSGTDFEGCNGTEWITLTGALED